jgi:hypothetical protein
MSLVTIKDLQNTSPSFSCIKSSKVKYKVIGTLRFWSACRKAFNATIATQAARCLVMAGGAFPIFDVLIPILSTQSYKYQQEIITHSLQTVWANTNVAVISLCNQCRWRND